MQLVKEGHPELVVLPYFGEGVLGAHVQLYDNGLVYMTTEYQFMTFHISQCTIIWWEKPVEGKTKKILKLAKKPDDGSH